MIGHHITEKMSHNNMLQIYNYLILIANKIC